MPKIAVVAHAGKRLGAAWEQRVRRYRDAEAGAIVWKRLERQELRRRARLLGGPKPGQRPGQRPVPSLPVGTDLLPQIEHIVVLMMENHSYDNYFGMLRGRGEGFPLGPGGEPELANRGSNDESVRAYRLPSTVQHPQAPSQSWHASHLQWGTGPARGSWPAPRWSSPTPMPPSGWVTGPKTTFPSITAWPGPSRW